MTTMVTIEAYSWPVDVHTFPVSGGEPVEGGEWSTPERVEPHTKRTFYVHSSQDLLIRERPLEASQAR